MVHVVLSCLLLAAPAAAQQEEIRFGIELGGVGVGTFAMRAERVEAADGARYSAVGRVDATRALDLPRIAQADGRMEASGTGLTARSPKLRLRPDRYEAESGAGRVLMSYVRGVARIDRLDPPAGPGDARPGARPGTLDPLSAAWAVLREMDTEEACAESFDIFDGRRAARLRMGDAVSEPNGGIVCSAAWERGDGYGARGSEPVTILYAPAGPGRVRAMALRIGTLGGEAVLRRLR